MFAFRRLALIAAAASALALPVAADSISDTAKTVAPPPMLDEVANSPAAASAPVIEHDDIAITPVTPPRQPLKRPALVKIN